MATRDLLRRNGHDVEILSGSSTGTYNIDSSIDGMTEMQSGSYVFMDVEYRKIGGESGPVYEDFAPDRYDDPPMAALLRLVGVRSRRVLGRNVVEVLTESAA